jgi:Flp pilus assembly protein TadG
MKQKPITGRKGRAGTALVETALTLGLFTSVVFSLFDFGYVMFMHQALASRLQIAARYGSLNPADTTGMKNYVLYNQTTGAGAGLFGLQAANVTASRLGSGTTADRVNITVTGFAFRLITPGHSGTAKPMTVSLAVEPN